MLILIAMIGALFAAAPPDDAHAALLSVLQRSDYAGACSPAELRAAATRADVRALGRVEGIPVVLADPQDPCMCGKVNCPWYVLRLDRGAPRVLLETIAYQIVPFGLAGPLPQLRENASDSALSRNETTDLYRGDRYVTTSTVRVRNDNGARKPLEIPVRFAPGTSSRVLRGRASLGWGDLYTFAAKHGQRVSVANVRSRAPLMLTIFLPKLSDSFQLKPGSAFTVPRAGRMRCRSTTARIATRRTR